jgi:histidinol-phosphate aminotransferase
MAPYSPPASGRGDKLRLDFNENTVGCSPRVAAYLKQILSEPLLSVYPEYEQTRPALAAHFGVNEDQLLLANGTDEAIQVLVNTFVDDGDEVIVLHPSYAMYRFYAEVAGAVIRAVDYDPGTLAFPQAALLDAITPRTKAILLANPNNPTGTAAALSQIEAIAQAAPHAAILHDEAYFEFCGITALGLLPRYPNLFVSRTFSKAYGMAALRMGCLMGDAAFLAYARKAQSPYSVNLLAAIAARAAIEDREYVDAFVREALAARELIYAGLAELKIHYWPSAANFVLFHAGDRSLAIRDELRRRGVLVRDRSYEIPGTVRVTTGTRDQAARFLQELKEIW